MIVVIEYGMGNVGSILNMLKKIGVSAVLSSSPKEIEKADKLILPGVGAYDHGMHQLEQRCIIPLLTKKVFQDRCPILGICLGMQLLTKKSEEGFRSGLGWIDAETCRFHFDGENKHLKIPHMGWNTVRIIKSSVLFPNLEEEFRFYFVHSYHIVCNNEADSACKTYYGREFTSAIQHENIYGTQFHPEKSHKYGMQLLKNFAELC